MTSRERVGGPRRGTGSAPRIGLFGLLGAGNVGNDGTMEALLAYVRAEHPDAVVTCLCSGPEQVTARYGIPAVRLNACSSGTRSGLSAVTWKTVGKIVDAVRTLRWVRGHDVVIVPGMGVLEATLPLRPWGFPYALCVLGASGRLVGTRTALVCVGADVIHRRVTRWLVVLAARLAHYRSYRDVLSRDAMRAMGLDRAGDEVYPDLAFALPTPLGVTAADGTVGVGVMAYHGGNDDRRQAAGIHRAYIDTMTRFVGWLVDEGRQVRLFTGDTVDETVVTEIVTGVRAHRPGMDPSRVVAEPTSTLPDLMRRMAAVDTVVATRYHNVLCALKLAKPTLSVGYAAKNDVLMAGMGLGEFCQSARAIDLQRLTEQFTELERRRDELVGTMTERNRANHERLERQFAILSTTVFPQTGSALDPVRTRFVRREIP